MHRKTNNIDKIDKKSNLIILISIIIIIYLLKKYIYMYHRNIYFLPLKQSLFYYSKKLFAYHYRLNIPTRYAIVTTVLLV